MILEEGRDYAVLLKTDKKSIEVSNDFLFTVRYENGLSAFTDFIDALELYTKL